MKVNYAQTLGLGQFDPIGRGQQYQQNAQNLAFNQQTMDMRGFQQEQDQLQADKQQIVDDNIGGALDGDPDAMREVWLNNPKLGQFFETRQAQNIAQKGAAQAEIINRKTANFLIELKNTPPEQRQALLDKALADPDIDYDDESQQSQALSGNDQLIDYGLYGLMGEDAYKAFYNSSKDKQFAPQVSTPQVDPETGQMFVIESDKNTGETRRVNVDGAFQRTGDQKRDSEVKSLIATETQKGKIERANKMKAELGDRNRQAARSSRTIAEALKLVAKADQGLTGAAKLQLSRLVPGIDTTNEGALDSVLNSLALEQLQLFKGPTTDYEFGVTQSIVGKLSDAKEANKARLKSLQRAGWFNEKEYDQYNAFIENGGDPDKFKFNFNEEIKVGNKAITLQQLQDTAVHYTLSIEEALRRITEKMNASNN